MTTLRPTVLRVLHWAAADSASLPPSVSGAAPEQGADGDPALQVERLATVTAARLRLSDPPLGDAEPAGLGAVLLATAVALRRLPEVAGMPLDAVSAPASVRDLLARHGLVRRVRQAADPALSPDGRLSDELLRHSPLTGLVHRPATAPGARAAAEQVLERLLAHPDGRSTLTTALAPPPADPETARWRAGVLERHRYTAGERQWVYDVYETALLHHRPELRRRTAHASAVLAAVGPVPPGPDERDSEEGRELESAEALAEWWRPLALLTHRHGSELRARPLLRGYGDGLRLCRIHRGVQTRTELTRLAAR